jgi:site-specific DNA-methyltransferase (adenine-specific)
MSGEFICADCMEYLPKYPDNYFDLAICDPPYGGGLSLMPQSSDTSTGASGSVSTATSRTTRGGADSMPTPSVKCGRTGGTWATKYQTNGGFFDHDIRHWDIAPEPVYFEQLRRVSKNQIIWGGNYFDLPPTRCFIVWRKRNIPADGFTMACVEYAWTSFNRNAECFEKSSSGTASKPRIHPTQKPIELYIWLLDKFAEPGMRILDTHVGSGSSLIACERMGFEYVGFEINRTYHRIASARIEEETRQLTLL